jgi:hypothetical protein
VRCKRSPLSFIVTAFVNQKQLDLYQVIKYKSAHSNGTIRSMRY